MSTSWIPVLLSIFAHLRETHLEKFHPAGRRLRLALAAGLLFAATAHGQLKIMPLGDSITDGDGSSNAAAYRSGLYTRLTNEGIAFDFVGSLSGGSGFPDIQHEGHGGYRADQIRDNVKDYLQRNPANLVLLLIGTNDLSQNQGVTSTHAEIGEIIDNIFQFNGLIEIYLATLLPRKDSHQSEIEELNALLPDLVASKRTQGVKIFLVDLNTRFLADPNWQSTRMFDNVHPNDAGYDVIAQVWYEEIRKNHAPQVVREFQDNFNRSGPGLGSKWAFHSAMQIRNNELVNTSSVDAWDHFLAIPKEMTNPRIVEFKYGANSDEVGRAFTGLAVMLNSADPNTADGYLVFHNVNGSTGENTIRLHELRDGVPVNPAIHIEPARAPAPKAGDLFRVEIATDNDGHKFTLTTGGVFDGVLVDPLKRQGNAGELFAGVQINGATNNGVDDFFATTASDLAAPGTITDLSVLGSSSASVTLQFTAPGDDGSIGQCTSYDVRYSTTAITAANYNLATRALGLKPPSLAGTRENLEVSGLQGGTTYYFAVKAVDDGGNTGEMSNVVQGTTALLAAYTDNFERPGPALGEGWVVGAGVAIVNGAIHNNGSGYQAGVLSTRRHPREVSLTWAATAVAGPINESGILVMASNASSRPNGYFIQHNNSSGKTVLWRVENGNLTTQLDGGNSFGGPIGPGTVMRVEYNITEQFNAFTVFINGKFDRELTDNQKLENGPYAGFMLDAAGADNAIDAITISVPIKEATSITAVSGNDQVASVGATLPQPLVVRLVDDEANPSPGKTVDFVVTKGDAAITPPPAPDGHIRIEAESGTIQAPLKVRNDAEAARGKYLTYPAGNTADAKATYTFDIAQAGTYIIWTRSRKNQAPAGSWMVSVDGGSDQIYDVFQGQTSDKWTWNRLSGRGSGTAENPQFNPRQFNFAAGRHTLEFKARYEETWLDKFIITSDLNFIPTGLEDPGFVTDGNGQASAIVTLGQTSGEVKIEARHKSLVPAQFTATAAGGAAVRLADMTNNNQTGTAGKELLLPFSVRVYDANNNPTAGHPVSWVITAGDGRLSSYTSLTDREGKAYTTLTLGHGQADNQVEARSHSNSGTPLTNSPRVFKATAVSGFAKSLNRTGGNNQTATVRTTLPEKIAVRVLEESNAGVPNVPVEFTVKRGGGTLAVQTGFRNGGFESVSGTTPASWSLVNAPTASEVTTSTNAPKAGLRSLEINAARTGVGVSQSPKYAENTNYVLTFWAKVVSGTAQVVWQQSSSTGELLQQTVDLLPAATGESWVQYRLFGVNGVAGSRPLQFKTSGSGHFFIDEVQLYPATDANGRLATTWTVGDTVGSQEVQAVTLVGSLVNNPVSFTANVTAGPAALLRAEGETNLVGSVNQPLSKPFVARVTDVTGINGVSGVAVTFKITAGGGRFQEGGTTRMVTSDASGRAAITLILGGQPNVANTVEASADGLSGSPVIFTGIAATPGSFTKIAGDAQRGSAGHRLKTPLTIRIKDENGNALPGFPVKFEITQGNGHFDGKAAVTINTNAAGDAQAFLTCDPAPGASNRVRASATFNNQPVNGSPQSFTVVNYGLQEIKLAAGNEQSGIVDQFLPNPLAAVVLDSAAQGIAGREVVFKVTEGGGKLEGGVTEKTVKTDSLGQARVRWRLGIRPVVNRATATSNPVLPGSPVQFSATAEVDAPATLSKVSGDSARGVVGNQLGTPFVTKVVDKHGNAVANVAVIFKVTAGGGNLNGQTSDTVRTNAGGLAQVILTLGPAAGSYNNVVEARASNGAIPLTNSPVRFVASAEASKAASVVAESGDRQTGSSGELLAQPFRVRVRDANGNAVKNHPVRFTVVRGGGKFSSGAVDSTVMSNDNGIAQVTLRLGPAVLPDSQIVQAAANDGVNPLKNSPLRFVAFATGGKPSAVTSYVQASGAVPADGVTPMPVTIFVRDVYDNPVPDQAVIIEVTNGPNEISQPTKKTDKEGKTTGSFTSRRAGAKTVTARITSGIAITNGSTVQFLPLAAQQLSLAGGNNQTGNLNAATPEPLRVKVEDRFGNGVAGHPVVFSVKTGEGRFPDGSRSLRVLSNTNGIAETHYVFGSTTGESQIWAEAAGLNNSPIILTANAVNRPARKLVSVGGNDQTGIAGEELPDSITVKVTDTTNRPVANIPVNFAVAFGGGYVSHAVLRSNIYGLATVAWRLGEQVGLNTLRVSSEGLEGSPLDFRANGIGGQPCCLQTVVSTPPSAPVGGTLSVTAFRVSDRFGNGVDGIPVQLELVSGTGMLLTPEAISKDGGLVSFTIIFDQVSGPRKIRARVSTFPIAPLTVTVYARAAAVASMTAVPRTNNQGGTVKKPLNFPLQVKLSDRYGNPVPDEAVNFVITAGGGFLNGQPNLSTTGARSDSNGIASAALTLGPNPGSNRVKVLRSGLPEVEFVANGFTNNFPIFTDVPDRRLTEGEQVEFKLAARDDDGDPIRFGASNLPPGSAFDSLATLVFTWVPNLTAAGIYEPAFYVRDNRGGIDIEIVRLEVLNRNRPPRIISRSPVGDAHPNRPDTTLLTEPGRQARLTLRVQAKDEDGDPLSFMWERNGRPVGGDSAQYTLITAESYNAIKVTVSDGTDHIATDWLIKVPVSLLSFSASTANLRGVLLSWQTSGEIQPAGFNLLRSLSRDGRYHKLNASLLPPQPEGEYSFLDETANAGHRYFYKLEEVEVGGNVTTHGPIQIEVAQPVSFALRQNYPNPFNPSTTIQYQLPHPGQVRLTIFNTLGQVVTRLVNRRQEAGFHTVMWHGRNHAGEPVPSGIYYYRLEVEGGFVETKKMVLAK
ncbi:MAG: Ig-like domain-containing protein [candidate division KSB1 bacterium]|nr:Ig-like domain-containing protein [candidate division KSB1 bacterium]MDZ7273820.1 Ig-like domain-containing protein [candidate division KSB1 bacterium]MDZ7285976.1 Ig-like domain-containing protein [candidate division KSB1 bacterium]MDZ7299008.1 Ig-like domain-containing protein [candidate division KSB1 bacterium]MDZ7307977.1 Ig-like domain-containing protein [candidate division KSB1 bacterium]